jgi:predicted nucleic acid-binding protein
MTASTASRGALVDTNILVYAYDVDDSAKHSTARELLERLSNEGRLVFSAEVFNEFCSVMMRPGRVNRLGPAELMVLLRRLEATGRVVPVTAALTFHALDAMPKHSLSFWDALIWAAAAEDGAELVYSEDFQSGREIDGVRFVDPFSTSVGPAV